MTIRVGLTGSIGMGKSFTAMIFAEFGCAVWDADNAVHRLYSAGGKAVEPVSRLLPDAIEEKMVSRRKLKEQIRKKPEILEKLENIVHPLVAEDREEFAAASMADIVIFDIPLLFENGTEDQMDAVVCVTVPRHIQRQRVLSRPGMTEEQFEFILSKQMPDSEKRQRADYVIFTETPEGAREQVKEILHDLRKRRSNA